MLPTLAKIYHAVLTTGSKPRFVIDVAPRMLGRGGERGGLEQVASFLIDESIAGMPARMTFRANPKVFLPLSHNKLVIVNANFRELLIEGGDELIDFVLHGVVVAYGRTIAIF